MIAGCFQNKYPGACFFCTRRVKAGEGAALYAEHESLAPRPGEIAVGGAHMDPLFKYDGVQAMRLALDAGLTLEAALGVGQAAAARSVRSWNNIKVRDYHVHRWDGTCDTYLENVAKQLAQAQPKGETP